jgi:hypothetical protein
MLAVCTVLLRAELTAAAAAAAARCVLAVGWLGNNLWQSRNPERIGVCSMATGPAHSICWLVCGGHRACYCLLLGLFAASAKRFCDQ